jgi:GT2 family glycosyltransferase
MKPITFCIATAKNEKEYIKLLLKSIKQNTDCDKHEILVFIDSDNQDTYGELLKLQSDFHNLKICKNTNQYPIGGQRNISIMFNAASNDIVCYLQSDMVVGKDFDEYIIESLTSSDIFACGTRVEPPLHPESHDKYTTNFGLGVESFDLDKFNEFVNNKQKQDKSDSDNYCVPFALYKNTWLNVIGGYDLQFRCSHEDIDSVVRLQLAGITLKQNWKALVYHFTCVSSRGVDWFKSNSEAQYKNEIQQLASNEEAKRFIRKWGNLDRNINYKYDIGLCIDANRYVDIEFIEQLEPFYDKLSISDSMVVDQLISRISFNYSYYSNLRWNYSLDHWNSVKHLYNVLDFKQKIITDKLDTDVVVMCSCSDLLTNKQLAIELSRTIQYLVHTNDIGVYNYEYFTVHINRKINKVQYLTKAKNPSLILDVQNFKFI